MTSPVPIQTTPVGPLAADALHQTLHASTAVPVQVTLPFPHLHPSVMPFMGGSDAQRIERARIAEFIEHPRVTQLFSMLERLHASPMRRDDLQDRVNGMLIAGPTLSGKTRLARHFLSRHPRNNNLGGDHVIQTVAHALAPDRTNVPDLYRRILAGLGEKPNPRQDREAPLRRQIDSAAEVCGLRMLFLDEIHSALEGTPRQQRSLMTAIKNLANDLSVSIVLLGTHQAASAIALAEELATRFPLERLLPWRENDDRFGDLLVSFEEQLPLRFASDLYLLSDRLHDLCGGSLGELVRLLALAAEVAIVSGHERIDDGMLDLTLKAGWQSPVMRAAQLRALEDNPFGLLP